MDTWFDLREIGDLTTALRMAAKEGGVSEEQIFSVWKKMLKEKEFWAVVIDFPKYIVSNRGRVMNYETGNFISDGSN